MEDCLFPETRSYSASIFVPSGGEFGYSNFQKFQVVTVFFPSNVGYSASIRCSLNFVARSRVMTGGVVVV